MKVSPKSILLIALCFSLAATGCKKPLQTTPPTEETVELPKRKNIDELTPDELAAYEHAVKMMKEKSDQNPFDRTGYIWQAWTHNCPGTWVTNNRQPDPNNLNLNASCLFARPRPGSEYHIERPGMCEHAKDIFLSWHRAEFYFFEKALQASDPDGLKGPSTKNVMVPFWNFTKRPSGDRYPKAFEDPNSPLFHANRDDTPVTSPRPYTSPYLLAYQLYFLDWQQFGGYEVGGAGNYGAFEAEIHNPMHSAYINGSMANPMTAANDPIFFSFHSFIDYIFETWIQEHGTSSITGGAEFMRSEQERSLPLPPGFDEGSASGTVTAGATQNMGRAEVYFDIENLGYGYQMSSGGDFIPKDSIERLLQQSLVAGSAFGNSPRSLFRSLMSYGGRKADSQPNNVFEGTLSIPNSIQSNERYLLGIIRNPVQDDFSFAADVYLHPVSVSANIADDDFRERYLAVSTAYWKLGGHHNSGGNTTALRTDLTQVLRSLIAAQNGGESWKISLAISSDETDGVSFRNPEVRRITRNAN